MLGAPEFVMPCLPEHLKTEIAELADEGLRVMLLTHTQEPLPDEGIPEGLEPVVLVALADNIRESARQTFAFFSDNDVAIKVISGDDPRTVSSIACDAGIPGARHYLDMSRVRQDQPLEELMETYTVFGRVNPAQKAAMVEAMQRIGHIVGMVGDGVNDAMALRQADVGVAMAQGSDAARTVADFVLVDSDFTAMEKVVSEGRRVVNNIEKVASLYIVKTIYTVMITLLFIFLPFEYPFQPIQLTLINVFMIGVPSFFLTFTPNYDPMHDRFGHQLVKDAVPAAFIIVLNIVAIQLMAPLLHLRFEEVSTLSVVMNGIVMAMLLIRVSRPLSTARLAMCVAMIAAYFGSMIFFRDFFELEPIISHLQLVWIPFAVFSFALFEQFTAVALAIERGYLKLRDRFWAWRMKTA